MLKLYLDKMDILRKHSKIVLTVSVILFLTFIFQDKFTRIFRMYHSFRYDDRPQANRTFSIKSHLIFYMYDDAQLLEVKSLNDNKKFESTMSHKIKLNLNLFYWIKSYINQ